MSRHRQETLLTLTQSSLRDYLCGIRGASGHAIRTYRDALRLFLLFTAERRRRSIAEPNLDDVNADAVLAFLDHAESRRGNSAAARNKHCFVLNGGYQSTRCCPQV